jgi:leader peptidase (prepilin peptidase)/N-methyltransferase
MLLYLIFLFVLGTAVGSFLNVCIHRLPLRESIILPASHCPRCGTNLNFIDLIPILGFILLRGRCRQCRAPISLRYPLVEFLAGTLFVLAGVFFPASSMFLDLIFCLIFISSVLAAFFIDLEHQVIPDAITFSGIFLGFLYHTLKGDALTSLSGIFLGWILFFLIAKLGKMLFKKEVLGDGDLYLAAMLGAFLGWQGMLLSVFMAYLLAGGVAILLLSLKRIRMGEYIPFGPALVSGGIFTLFFGQQLIAWYVGLFM